MPPRIPPGERVFEFWKECTKCGELKLAIAPSVKGAKTRGEFSGTFSGWKKYIHDDGSVYYDDRWEPCSWCKKCVSKQARERKQQEQAEGEAWAEANQPAGFMDEEERANALALLMDDSTVGSVVDISGYEVERWGPPVEVQDSDEKA